MGIFLSKDRLAALVEHELSKATSLAEALEARRKSENTTHRGRHTTAPRSASSSDSDVDKARGRAVKRNQRRTTTRHRSPSYDEYYDDRFCGRCGKRRNHSYSDRTPLPRYQPPPQRVVIENLDHFTEKLAQPHHPSGHQGHSGYPNQYTQSRSSTRRPSERPDESQTLPGHLAESLQQLENTLKERHRMRVAQDRATLGELENLVRERWR